MPPMRNSIRNIWLKFKKNNKQPKNWDNKQPLLPCLIKINLVPIILKIPINHSKQHSFDNKYISLFAFSHILYNFLICHCFLTTGINNTNRIAFAQNI
jgi:hypothetical protein